MGWTQPSVSNPASVGQGGLNDHQEEGREGPKIDIRTLGIDLAKNLFRVHGVDAHGRTVVERELRRRQLLPFVAQLRPCLMGMEACGGAHYWAREIAKRGHEVRLMSPRFVRPYVKSNKNDARDAEAICEAVGRPSMRFVAVKSQAQQDMLALHRVRSLLVRERTALMNQMRGLLAEYGIVVVQGAVPLRRALALILEERDNGVSEILRELLLEMSERQRPLRGRLKRYDQRITEFPFPVRTRQKPHVRVAASGFPQVVMGWKFRRRTQQNSVGSPSEASSKSSRALQLQKENLDVSNISVSFRFSLCPQHRV